MYRPQSQISRQQLNINFERRSNDIRDLQSRTKKLSNKQYKDYVKRLIENNPNHIDSERRLKIDTMHSNKNELRERIEKKLGDDEKQMWRSGVVRFIKPRISQRDYKRFKKLFDIFTKIQKTKHEILSLTFSTTKYIKDSNSLYQNQRLKQLKDNLLKLQLDQQKILLEIQNEGKQNKNQCFSLQKVANSYKRNQVIEKKFSDLQRYEMGKKQDGSQTPLLSQNNINEQSPNCNKRIESQCNNNMTGNKHNNQQHQQLTLLYDFIWSIDGKKSSKCTQSPQQKQNLSINLMSEEIKNFIILKQKTIDQLFVKLTEANNINHKDQHQQKSSQLTKQSSFNQFNKFHQIDRKSKCTSLSSQQQNKKYNSFKSLLSQIEEDLRQLKQMNGVKERNNQLAKKLLTTNKQLQLCQQQKIDLQRELNKRAQQENQFNKIKRQNQQLVKIREELQQDQQKTTKQLQQAYKTIQQLQSKIQKYEQSFKQHNKLQKYYRQTLTLQQQLKILSQQNQKLVQQLNNIKQQHEQQRQKQRYQRQKQKQRQKEKQLRQNNNNSMKLSNNQRKTQQLINNNDDRKQSNNNTHEKSIKPCSTTSLIYKQFQKKNKKLNQQNIRVTQQNNRITEQKNRMSQQINRLSQLNRVLEEKMKELQKQKKQLNNKQIVNDNQSEKLRQQNKVLQQQNKVLQKQNKVLSQQNKFMQQQNKILLQQNKKIQQQFEYLVKQKLQLQSHLSQLQKINTNYNTKLNRVKSQYKQRLVEMYENILELKQDKQYLIKEINQLSYGLKEMFSCLSQEITNALEIFVNGIVQSKQKQQQQQQQQQQQLLLKQTNNQNLPNPQVIPETTTILLQQEYQRLVNEFNHCLYELNSFKAMLNQLQIQKQLQKKYYQQDINLLKIQIITLENQIIILKDQFVIKNDNKLKDQPICVVGKQQVEDMKERERQILMQTLYTQTLFFNTQHNIQIHSNIVSYIIQPQQQISTKQQTNQKQLQQLIQSRRQKLKINCESSSILISPQHPFIQKHQYQYQQYSTQTQTYQLLNNLSLYSQIVSIQLNKLQTIKIINSQQTIMKIDKAIENKSIQTDNLISLEQWFNQLQQESFYEDQNFTNFCLLNIQTSYHQNQQIYKQQQQQPTQKNTTKRQSNNQHSSTKHQHSSIKQQHSFTKRLSLNNQLSNNKAINKIESTQQQGNEKIGIFGSLYNKFSFPKLQPTQTKYQLNKKLSNKQINNNQIDLLKRQIDLLKRQEYQLSLQCNNYSIKNINKTQSNTLNNQIPSNNNQQNNLYSMTCDDEDQSFDLCII